VAHYNKQDVLESKGGFSLKHKCSAASYSV